MRSSTLARTSFATATLVGLTSMAAAQVTIFSGAPPNATTTVDFDNPPATLGPIASSDPYFTMLGIASVDVVGTWSAAGDLLNTTVMGQSLSVTGGQLTVSALNDPIDSPTAGAGIEITFQQAWDEIGLVATDQIGFTFDVELFNGNTSLGTAQGPFPGASGVYFRAVGQKADRIVFTDTNGGGGWGIDNIAFGDGPPPMGPPDECVETTFIGGNGGSTGGAVYFDLDVGVATNLTSLQMNYDATAGSAVGLEVYTKTGSVVGFEADPNPWTLAGTDDGMAIAAGAGVPTDINLAAPIALSPGTTGIALVAIGAAHDYTNGNGTNEVYTSGDGNLTLTGQSASNVVFSGSIFSVRVYNGRLCTDGLPTIGTNYCMALANSTGVPAEIIALGSETASDNDLTLVASNMPPQQFGIFVTSQTQAAMPVQSGILCVGTPQARFNDVGQIQVVGPDGSFEFQVDTTQIPLGTSVVAIQPGDTWNFTAWFRDLDPSMANTANFSDGVEITFN